MEMQPLVLQESINLCDAQRKSYHILEFMSMSCLQHLYGKSRQCGGLTQRGGTVATLHVTRTAITEEHMNRLNMCIRNTLMLLLLVQFSSVSHACFFASPWTAAHQASVSITNSRSLVKLMYIDLVMPSNQLILCHPLLLLHSAFFRVQLSHPYMTTGNTTALTRWMFVDKVMSLLFNMLFRLVIIFLPRSKRLSISRLQSPSTAQVQASGKGAQAWPRGATPRPRSGVTARRSYPTSKVRSSGCALLEKP